MFQSDELESMMKSLHAVARPATRPALCVVACLAGALLGCAAAHEPSPRETSPDEVLGLASPPDASVPAPAPIDAAIAAPAPIDAAIAAPAPADAAIAAPAPVPSFRPFVAPKRLAIARPPRRNQGCDRQAEREREYAALDAELRRQGGMLLFATPGPVAVRSDGMPNPDVTAGGVVRGPQGERHLVVSERGGVCSGPLPSIGIDAEGEVFVIDPKPLARRTRKSGPCGPDCSGRCGVHAQPRSIVVEVPEGAHLGPRRTVSFPMKVRVVFPAARACMLP